MGVKYVTTTLLAAVAQQEGAGAYDLTTLANAQNELSLPSPDTSQNAFLQRVITEMSTAINNYTNRVFQVETLQDILYIQQDPYPYQVPGGVLALQLSRWPLVNAIPVNFTGDLTNSTTIENASSTNGLEVGMPIGDAQACTPIGAYIEAIEGSTITLSLPAVVPDGFPVNGLALNAGVQVQQQLSATVTQNLIYGTAAQATAAAASGVTGPDFTIDTERGWLLRLNEFTGVETMWEALPTTVCYQSGYETVPPDLEGATLRLVTARFMARGRDPMIVEQSQGPVGTQRFWVGSLPGQQGAFAPEIQSVIDQYRVPVVQ